MDTALFGRYWPAQSIVHRLDPRAKITGLLLFMVAVFCAGTYPAQAVVFAALVCLVAASRIPPLQALRSIAPLVFIIVLTVVLNLLFVQGGAVYVHAGPLQVSQQGVHSAVFVGIRLFMLLLAGSLLTLTTTTLDITEACESMLRPFARFGFPAHELGMVLGIALRFLPQFADEFRVIRAAQLSRGAQLATSPLRGRLVQLASLLVPLFASAFRHAETLADAMESRAYHGAPGRTRLHELHFARRDAVALAACAALAVCAVAVSQLA